MNEILVVLAHVKRIVQSNAKYNLAYKVRIKKEFKVSSIWIFSRHEIITVCCMFRWRSKDERRWRTDASWRRLTTLLVAFGWSPAAVTFFREPSIRASLGSICAIGMKNGIEWHPSSARDSASSTSANATAKWVSVLCNNSMMKRLLMRDRK